MRWIALPLVIASLTSTAAAQVPPGVTRIHADSAAQPLDIIWLLAGRIPTAVVTAAEGGAGFDPDVTLRGAPLTSHRPLVMVDGSYFDGPTSQIDPANVDYVDVFAGPAAAARFGSRGAHGAILIHTRRPGGARGVSFRLASEASGMDQPAGLAAARRTPMLLDESGTRLCVTAPGAGLCEHTTSWSIELARVNNHPDDTVATAAMPTVAGFSSLSGTILRNRYQAERFPGTTRDQTRQGLRNGALTNLGLDIGAVVMNTRIRASLSRLDADALVRFRSGRERYSAGLQLERQLGARLAAAATLVTSSAGFDAVSSAGLLMNLSRESPLAETVMRDSLGRLYRKSSLVGSSTGNPLRSLELEDQGARSGHTQLGASVRYALTSALDLEARFTRLQSWHRGTQRFLAASGAGILHVRNDGALTATEWALSARVRRQLTSRLLATAIGGLNRYATADSTAFLAGALPVPPPQGPIGGGSAATTHTGGRTLGIWSGLTLDYLARYQLDALVRHDRVRTFGNANETFGRLAAAWNLSRERWWFAPRAIPGVWIRAAHGSAGSPTSVPFTAAFGPPGFPGGGSSASLPLVERAVETEATIDVELAGGIALRATRSMVSRDLVLPVPIPADRGFGFTYQNAGELEERSTDIRLDIPLLRGREAAWRISLGYGATRATIGSLTVPPFSHGTSGMLQARAGERLGTIYGYQFARSCDALPAAWRSDCGVSGVSSFQLNDDGYLVWVGALHSPDEGITGNLWQTSLPGGDNATSPWGVAFNWGMPIVVRDTACANPGAGNAQCPGMQLPLGNVLPDFQFTAGTSFRWQRLTVAALLHGSVGRDVWNLGRHWSYLEMASRDQDQLGSVETAKPLGYYYRAGPADGFAGTGGFYHFLTPNSHFIEEASYAKLRELTVSWNVGSLAGAGEWTVTVTGRNLLTIGHYEGIDPDVPYRSADASLPINGVDDFALPLARTIGLSFVVRF